MKISEKLKKVREYEEKMGARIPAGDRPAFHLSSRVGWMNDPNGFSIYQGKYHLFYQYYPYNTVWGPCYWGHAISEDLIHWEYLPAALAPDESYDNAGCFSGSAVTLPDGRQMLIYTGVIRREMEDGSLRDIQQQCLAFGDGLQYEKYESNPVLTGEDLPEDCSPYDFRDPNISVTKDGTYRIVTCCGTPNRDGRTVMFTSPDGIHWGKGKILIRNNDRFGKVWECPDFFRVGDKWVLLCSPMDMFPEGFEYHNGNGTLCLIGDYDEERGVFMPQHDQSIDYGIDFYATQTILAEDGRRIMIAWMQNWDTTPGYRLDPTSWFGQMTIPRELSVREGRLYQWPVRELERIRRNAVSYENVYVSGQMELDGIRGRMIDMEIAVRPADPEHVYEKFTIRFAAGGPCYTMLSYHPGDQIMKIDRKFSGSRRAIIHQRRALVPSQNGEIRIRLILDRFSAEAFVNDGAQTITANLYTEMSAKGISFAAQGAVSMDLVKYDLVP
ncbi:MAG: glycoside hydrolase family 32 protein [Lachnospiraceae bacterium]|nr:glycoside hydrolase family 32 protein [Lachnospiraceae bacterium]